MKVATTFTRAQARAIRNDVRAGNASSLAMQQIGIDCNVLLASAVSVRIGERPKRDIMHMDKRDFRRYLDVHPRWFRRGPTCRVCLKRIRHGEKAIEFEYRKHENTHWTRTLYIHQANCEGG